MHQSAMTGIVEGRGHLEAWDYPNGKIEVAYRFEITTDILTRPGFPRVAAHKHSAGVVYGMRNESVQPGYYRLFAADGEVLRVENLGGQWVILAS